ncbi:MAG TPA: hypothetical protein VGL77_13455, partial [Armatimonadota bacterium]
MSHAGRVIVDVNTKDAVPLVSLDVKDAEMGMVLTSLFNATHDRYMVQIGVGVSGTVDQLQLT